MPTHDAKYCDSKFGKNIIRMIMNNEASMFTF